MKTIKAHPTYGKKLRLAAFVVGVAVTLLAMSSYSPVLAQADTQNSIVNNADHSDRRFYVAGDRIVFQGAVPPRAEVPMAYLRQMQLTRS